MAIEAVLWDFGGVFTTSPFEAFNRYEVSKGIPKDLIRTVNATNPLENAWALFERAEIDRDGFDLKFLEESTALGHPVRGADVLPLLSGDVRPRMVEALRICKQHFRVGCITNNMAQGHGPGMATSEVAASRTGASAATSGWSSRRWREMSNSWGACSTSTKSSTPTASAPRSPSTCSWRCSRPSPASRARR